MSELTDELLCAYMDGELSPEGVAWVDAQLEQDPEARLRLEAFREASSLIRGIHREEVSKTRHSLQSREAASRTVPRNGMSNPVKAWLTCTGAALLIWVGRFFGDHSA